MTDPRAGASSVREPRLKVNYAGLAATHAALAVVEAALQFPALKEAWSHMSPSEWHAVRQAVKAALLAAPPAPPQEQEQEDATRVDGERRAAGPTGSTAAGNEADRVA